MTGGAESADLAALVERPDIITRLRQAGQDEAAEAIDLLYHRFLSMSEERADMQGQRDNERAKVEALAAENARLRDALTELMPMIVERGMKGETDWERAVMKAQAALAALSASGPHT